MTLEKKIVEKLQARRRRRRRRDTDKLQKKQNRFYIKAFEIPRVLEVRIYWRVKINDLQVEAFYTRPLLLHQKKKEEKKKRSIARF